MRVEGFPCNVCKLFREVKEDDLLRHSCSRMRTGESLVGWKLLLNVCRTCQFRKRNIYPIAEVTDVVYSFLTRMETCIFI